MAFSRPTLTELITRTENDLVSRLQIASTVLRRALVRIIARVLAGAVHGVHGHIEWAARQLFATTADQEYLELHGKEIRVERKAAEFASGNVTFTGTTDGTPIPAGTRLLRQDGAEYETTAHGTIVSGTTTVPALATVAGAAGNADAGVSLALISPIAGVASAAVVAAGGIDAGVDAENYSAYRARILSRKRNPPQGGSEADYLQWATEVPGVTRAWVYKNYMGAGTVGVTFVMDGEANIIPDAAKVAEVQAYIDTPGRRPLCAQVDVYAPIAAPVNLTIEVSPDTPEVRAAVTAELRDLLFREGEPGATLIRSHIDEAISAAVGEHDHDLVHPVGDITLDPSELPILGAITWV